MCRNHTERTADPELAAEDERERRRKSMAKHRAAHVGDQSEVEDLVFQALGLGRENELRMRQKHRSKFRSILVCTTSKMGAGENFARFNNLKPR
jgi:hypothetical protein